MRRMLTCATAEMHAHATYADMPQHSRIALVSAVACFTDIGDAKRLQFTAILGNDGTHSLGHVCVRVVRRLVSAEHTSTQVSIRQRMRVVRRLVSAVISKACQRLVSDMLYQTCVLYLQGSLKHMS